MALTKTVTADKIEVIGDHKHINVRTATIIKEDGTELSRSFSRKVLEPGSIDDSDNYTNTNVSSEHADVQSIANAIWSTTVHDAWKAYLIANKV